MNIVFAHNVYNRFKTLNNTIRVEKILFAKSNCVVGYNVESPANELIGYDNLELIKFSGVTHKIGCTNGCIATIKAAIKYNPDVIVFSHDDVSLHYSEESYKVFMENVQMIKDGKYDVIVRKPLPTDIYGNEYYLMEVFFLSKKAAEIAFGTREYVANERDILKDKRGSISPEVFLYEALNNKDLKILEKGYEHKLDGYNKTLSTTMGYTHKNAGDRGWTDN